MLTSLLMKWCGMTQSFFLKKKHSQHTESLWTGEIQKNLTSKKINFESKFGITAFKNEVNKIISIEYI